jgi:hypothetical protein
MTLSRDPRVQQAESDFLNGKAPLFFLIFRPASFPTRAGSHLQVKTPHGAVIPCWTCERLAQTARERVRVSHLNVVPLTFAEFQASIAHFAAPALADYALFE